MGIAGYWEARRRFLGRAGNPRPIWRILIMLAIILYLIYRFSHLEHLSH
ncbi:hypothetical protein LLH00_13530 [bacterium]|nr:hypothetical protein [bacterium]